MKIAFLCSSLEPGHDGVGDYTRRLAGEFIRNGHLSVAVGLNDSESSLTEFEEQQIDGISIPVFRLSTQISWDRRTAAARRYLEKFGPDWVSLQFVPFGFDLKGICFGLGNRLAAINRTAPWHVMFHELWLGLEDGAAIRKRLWGALQKIAIRDMVRRLRPKAVHTQTGPFNRVLNRERIPASILPIFSNVPVVRGDAWEGLLEPLIHQATGHQADRAKIYLAGVFGNVHPEWSAEKAVNLILPIIRNSQKRLVMLFFGRSHMDVNTLEKLRFTLRNRADLVSVGERPTPEISRILQSIDLGVATTPMQAFQKSGSVVAMIEHGLPVLVIRDDWHLREANAQSITASSQLLSPEQFALLATPPSRELRSTGIGSVSSAAEQMLAALGE